MFTYYVYVCIYLNKANNLKANKAKANEANKAYFE